ncbi:TPA: glycosyltransferase [Candidatus Taylorbacteria bacterium]|nr:glycosyltransferase [Candidatus Taylorbacteria bacterium]
MQKTISIIVPVYNEEKNIPLLKGALSDVFSSLPYDYEIIFVDDGSKDFSQLAIETLTRADKRVKSIEFSRNFGKEVATSAGLQYSTGDAAIMIDADLQHPVSLIPQFIRRWENGADVVIGLRTKNNGQSLIKSICSFLYYKIINAISETPIEPGATDFRLVDRKVINEFNRFTEHERMTRGLIDWLGFKREFIKFETNERVNGTASYSYLKLIKPALSSSVSHSMFPLRIAGYLGIWIVTISGIGGLVVFAQRYLFNEVFSWHISGSAQLAILMIFFIGVVLSCLGLIALYIGNIHNEVSGRPLYSVRSMGNIKRK